MNHSNFRPAWALTGSLAFIDLSLAPFAGFSLSAGPLFWAMGITALLVSVSTVYHRVRPEPAIAAALSGTAVIIAYTAVAAIFSYLATANSLPLQDSVFESMDKAIGFDFAGHLQWIGERPSLLGTLEAVYFSYAEQLIVIICGLAFVNRPALGRFMHVYAVCALAVVAIGALLPAVGPYSHHPLSPDVLTPFEHLNAGRSQVEHFLTLRSGEFRQLSLASAEGLVNFPSFHAALAIIFARALWRLPYVRFPGLALNAGMMVSAISIGGHYLVDLIGGSLIAIATLFWLDREQA